jgi:DNA-binding transcriptional LysR family regulator
MTKNPQGHQEFSFGHLKLRHLHLLSLLEQERSITRAAEILHLSQPAVSSMLKELESIFGIRMVERSPRGVSLTQGAHAALRRFSIALAELDTVRDEAVLAEQHARKRLRVGVLTVVMVDLIPRAMRTFLSTAGPVQVQFIEGTVNGLSEQLMHGELDCIVGRVSPAWAKSAASAQLQQVRLFDEPRCMVCRAGHPLAQRTSLGLSVLAQQEWILAPEPFSSRLVFDEIFLERGLSPPVPVIESASVHSNIEIVAVTDLLAVAPLSLARRMITQGTLRKLQVSATLTGMSISFIWRRTGDTDALIGRFRDALVVASVGRVRKK